MTSTGATRAVLEEISSHGQDNRQDPQLTVNEDPDSELTDLEREIVAKYLMEMEGFDANDKEPFDLNNNSSSSMDEGHLSTLADDKENMGDTFPPGVPKEELMALSTLLQRFPQLTRSTSLDSTTSGGSVEDLVSACPPLVHLLKQAAAAAAAATATAATSSPVTGTDRRDNNNPIHDRSSSSSSSADAAVGVAGLANANAGFVLAQPNDSRTLGDRIAPKLVRGDSVKGIGDRNKAARKRPNYSVWMGVTSCIWGLLFYLAKNYL